MTTPVTAASRPRIGLIHALEESVRPARAAFSAHWPEADCFDLLDTSLAADLAARGNLDQSIVDRFLTLGRYAAGSSGAAGATQALLFTCSAFGPAIDAVKRDLTIPVLRPNEAAFEEALNIGSRIGLVVTFRPSLEPLTRELRQMAAARGQQVSITGIVAEDALAALKSNRGDDHDRIVGDAIRKILDIDVLILAQFSLARALPIVARAIDVPILATPHSAVKLLKRAVTRC